MKKLTLAALLALTVIAPAVAQSDWIQYEKNDTATFYLRPSSIHEVAGRKRIWNMTSRVTPNKNGDLSRIMLDEFNCDSRQSRLIQVTYYKGKMGSGSSSFTSTGPFAWEYVIPNTVGETLLDLVCAK
jgi:hypothetical protein